MLCDGGKAGYFPQPQLDCFPQPQLYSLFLLSLVLACRRFKRSRELGVASSSEREGGQWGEEPHSPARQEQGQQQRQQEQELEQVSRSKYSSEAEREGAAERHGASLHAQSAEGGSAVRLQRPPRGAAAAADGSPPSRGRARNGGRGRGTGGGNVSHNGPQQAVSSSQQSPPSSQVLLQQLHLPLQELERFFAADAPLWLQAAGWAPPTQGQDRQGHGQGGNHEKGGAELSWLAGSALGSLVVRDPTSGLPQIGERSVFCQQFRDECYEVRCLVVH